MSHPYLYFEEKLNTISHGIGFILAIVGSYYLIASIENTSSLYLIAGLLYCVSLVSLYLASTLYHYFVFTDKHLVYQKLDHISIYALIAGTYSPVCLITLLDSKGILLFVLVWGIALLGLVFKVFYTGKFVLLSTLLYLVMGWLILFDIVYLKEAVSEEGVAHLFYGGAAYTVGIIFYLLKKMPFSHFIWHLFVLAGSTFHFWFIYKFVF